MSGITSHVDALINGDNDRPEVKPKPVVAASESGIKERLMSILTVQIDLATSELEAENEGLHIPDVFERVNEILDLAKFREKVNNIDL